MLGSTCWSADSTDSSVFQFGDSQKLRLLRILRSTVMVRVGGGWETLQQFLNKNDPCKGEETDDLFSCNVCHGSFAPLLPRL